MAAAPHASSAAPVSARRWTIAAATMGIAAAVLSTWPLVTALGDAIPVPKADCSAEQCADHLLCVWIVGEGGRRLYRHPLTLFDANIFHPFRHTLAFSESMLSAGALVAPINALTGNPVLGYDLYYLATIALAALGAFLLVREITGDPRAGLVAGWMFALASERFEFGGLLPAVAVQWAPFVPFAALRLLGAPSPLRALGFGAALLAHLHASAYHGPMLCALLVPWALVLVVAGPWPVRRWLVVGAVAVVAGGLGAALYLPYLAVREELDYRPSILGIALSVRWWGPFVRPQAYLGELGGPRAGFSASPLPVLLLVAAGLAALVRRPGAPAPRGERAQLAAAIVIWVLLITVSLGRRLWIADLVHGVPGPLALLTWLPGFDVMRVPARFTLLASFGAALVAGISVAILCRRAGRVGSALLVLGLAAVVLVDTRTLRDELPLMRVERAADYAPVYGWVATATPPETAILEIPYGRWGDEVRYMLRSLHHGRRLFNGYSAAMPRFDAVFTRFPDDVSLRALADAGVRYAIVHGEPSGGGAALAPFLDRIRERGDLASRMIGPDLVVDVPTAPLPEPPRSGVALEPAGWRLTGSEPGAERAADGDLATAWQAKSGGFLRVDLGRVERVSGVTVRLGPRLLDYPRSYTLLASREGTEWEQIGGEAPALPPFAAYRRNHRDVEMPLRLSEAHARFLEIRVPAYPPLSFTRNRWAVHELGVRAAP